MKITHDWLIEHAPCEEGLEWFDRNFPDGVELTRANLTKYAVDCESIEWLVRLLLKDKAFEDFNQAEARLWDAYASSDRTQRWYRECLAELAANSLNL